MKKPCVITTAQGAIPFVLTRSSGRRTLTISVDEKAEARVAAPFHMADRDVYAFLHEKAEWLCDKINAARDYRDRLRQKAFDHGQRFLFLGKKHDVNVVAQKIQRCRISFDTAQGWLVAVPGNLSGPQRRLQVRAKMIQWYRSQAKEILGGRVFHYARLMGIGPKRIAIRTQKRLWGCCDYRAQSINLNWQIILAPLEVIDYIVIHELCHLTVPSHSHRFWKKVEKIMPDYRKRRQWLKVNHIDMMLPAE